MACCQSLVTLHLSLCAIAACAAGQDGQPAATRPVPEWIAIPQDSIPDPKLGMTIEQVESLLKQKDPRPFERSEAGEAADELSAKILAMHAEHERMLTHGFTIQRDDHELIGMTPLTSPWTTFVFSDGTLATIVRTPPRPGKIVDRKGDCVWQDDPAQPMQRCELVVNAEPLSTGEFIAFTKQKREADLNAKIRYSEPPAIPPALLAAIKKRVEGEFEKRREEFLRSVELRKKFDPLRVSTMMTPQQVEAHYGQVKHERQEKGGAVTRVYGAHLDTTEYSGAWVAVLFKDDKVQAVWSHDFLDKTLLPARK